MPATTRSRSQTTLEDKGVSSPKPAPIKASGAKRKASETKTATTKKQKTQHNKHKTEDDVKDEPDNEKDASNSISINRAPVLELWSSCIAQFLHPSLPWSTALSIGSAISTTTAISKGRSIGTIAKPDESSAEKREKRKETQADLDEIDVMSFHLKINDGNAMVGDKPKKGNEEGLRRKFGHGDEYDRVKQTFQDALGQWKGREDELDSRAFHMYEDFRPGVPKGQKGWGRKGQLNLESVKSAVAGG